MNTHLIAARLAQRGLTPHTIADLVGIHPRDLTSDTGRDLSDLPVATVIAIARQLDVDPADLVEGLTPAPAPQTTLGRQVLAALANAPVPLTPEQLAHALDADTDQVRAVLEQAAGDPDAGFPFAVVPAGGAAWRLAPRTSPLPEQAHRRMAQVPLEQGPLNVDQARVLFFALVGEPVAEGDAGLVALRDEGLLTTADRAGVCADLALALDPGEPEEVTHSDQSAGSGWEKKAAGY